MIEEWEIVSTSFFKLERGTITIAYLRSNWLILLGMDTNLRMKSYLSEMIEQIRLQSLK